MRRYHRPLLQTDHTCRHQPQLEVIAAVAQSPMIVIIEPSLDDVLPLALSLSTNSPLAVLHSNS